MNSKKSILISKRKFYYVEPEYKDYSSQKKLRIPVIIFQIRCSFIIFKICLAI